jgi:glycerophosphoryl diester phosphodiesterase
VFSLRERKPANRPLIVGHRGAMGHRPENTMPSFELGAAMGSDLLECDVHLSQDGVPVVIHDNTLDRTTKGTGPVAAQNAGDLRALGVPTLDELLAWCRDRVPLSIELKNGPVFYEGMVEKVVDLVRKHQMIDHATLISFDHQAIRRARELEQNIAVGILYAARLVDAPAAAHAAWADAVMPHHGFATPDVVQQAHAAGLAISVWTVDDPDTAKRLAALGVDAIATNYPDRILAALSP